jgi:hypothetical protein
MEQARFDMLGMDVHRAVTADALIAAAFVSAPFVVSGLQ